MNNFNFKKVSTIDISPYIETVKNFTKEDWERFKYRQITWDVHRHTRTVPLLFDIDNMNRKIEHITHVTPRLHYPKFKSLLDRVSGVCEEVYGKGYLLRALLTELKAKHNIDRHHDEGDNLARCKRVHMALITDPKCIFTVGDESKYMKPGELWEINNAGKKHLVQNQSDVDRVHLITDWVLDV